MRQIFVAVLLALVATEVKSDILSSILDPKDTDSCADIKIGRNYEKSLCLIARDLTFSEAENYCKSKRMKLFKPRCLRMGNKCRDKFLETFDDLSTASVWFSSSDGKSCKSVRFPSTMLRDVECSEKRWAFCTEAAKRHGKSEIIRNPNFVDRRKITDIMWRS